MRTLLLGLLVIASPGLTFGPANIRQVDFKNFTYPITGSKLGHERLMWMSLVNTSHVRLAIGEDVGKHASGWPNFKLESVKFADVTGNGKQNAIVVLRYDSGGTQTTHYVYIYSLGFGRPKLLAYCHTGSRSGMGLYNVYGQHGTLVFELLDPKKAVGDCCSTGFIRTRYRWRKGRFEALGAPEYGTIPLEVH
jgi:hypothetical protein